MKIIRNAIKVIGKKRSGEVDVILRWKVRIDKRLRDIEGVNKELVRRIRKLEEERKIMKDGYEILVRRIREFENERIKKARMEGYLEATKETLSGLWKVIFKNEGENSRVKQRA